MSMLIKAGAVGGILSGMSLGAMAGPNGFAPGAACGLIIGLCAGYVMHREDARKTARTKELDEIIGTTSGRLGRSSLIPPLPSDETLALVRQRRWVQDWMTPVAPKVAMR